MLKKEDEMIVEMYKEMTPSLYATLNLLYQPLLGDAAYLFYTTLVSLKHSKMQITNHVLLHRLTGLSMNAMEKARKRCEEFMLIRTYFKEDTRSYLYIVDVPMKSSRFLSHEVFGRLFLDKMGEDVVAFYKQQMKSVRKNRSGYHEVSVTMQHTLQNHWNEGQEKTFLDTQKEMEEISYNYLHVIFDEKLFLSGLSEMVFPKKERTRKNMRTIAEIATIYGINESMMKSLIAKGIVLPDNKFSAEKLKKACLSTKAKYVSDTKNPYTLPPRRYLEYKQHGVSLSRADLLLIEKLMGEYRLQPEVVNVLLDTCLRKYDQKIVGTSVERMAAGWLRLGIDTLEKAKEQMEKECSNTFRNNSKPQIVQHWDKNEETISEEEKLKMIEEIQRMRGE